MKKMILWVFLQLKYFFVNDELSSTVTGDLSKNAISLSEFATNNLITMFEMDDFSLLNLVFVVYLYLRHDDFV